MPVDGVEELRFKGKELKSRIAACESEEESQLLMHEYLAVQRQIRALESDQEKTFHEEWWTELTRTQREDVLGTIMAWAVEHQNGSVQGFAKAMLNGMSNGRPVSKRDAAAIHLWYGRAQ